MPIDKAYLRQFARGQDRVLTLREGLVPVVRQISPRGGTISIAELAMKGMGITNNIDNQIGWFGNPDSSLVWDDPSITTVEYVAPPGRLPVYVGDCPADAHSIERIFNGRFMTGDILYFGKLDTTRCNMYVNVPWGVVTNANRDDIGQLDALLKLFEDEIGYHLRTDVPMRRLNPSLRMRFNEEGVLISAGLLDGEYTLEGYHPRVLEQERIFQIKQNELRDITNEVWRVRGEHSIRRENELPVI